MSLKSKRRTILLDSEIQDLYGAPKLAFEQKRYYFSLNDPELDAFRSIRDRYNRVYFVLLLGYFKVKPVILNIRYSDVRDDLLFIAGEFFPDMKLGRKNLSPMQRVRIYRRIFQLLDYQSFDEDSEAALSRHAAASAAASIESRFLFDESIDYLAKQRIAIPKYTVLQRVVSRAIASERQRLADILSHSMSQSLGESVDAILDDETATTLNTVRQSARNFSLSELEKELSIHQQIEPLIDDIDAVVQQLGLSLSNLDHFSSMVDYYTPTKLRRFDKMTRSLYLLCYLHLKYRQVTEHLADAFIHHCRKLQQEAKQYADDTAYQEWKEAVANVGKGATLLRLFIDDSIDGSVPFSEIRQRAAGVMRPKQIESLCRYLTDQKQSQAFYIWEYYDQQTELIEQALRPIFLALKFQSSTTTRALGAQIERSQFDLDACSSIREIDRRLIRPRHLPFVAPGGSINPACFEVLLYLLVQGKLDGHLFIPQSPKHCSLADDLVDDDIWKHRRKLIKSSLLNRINTAPKQLMRSMQKELATTLEQVGERIQKGDNRNVILRSRSGKTQWRLPSSGAKSLLNNPFFEQLNQVNIADLMRFVDQETGFLDTFDHVRQVRARQAVNANNLIAAIIANGTNYGLYRMAHISDRSYEELRSTQANYLRMETLNQANDAISNAIAKLEIFQHYNIQEGVLHASADGQKFESRLHTFKTRYSSKYFGTNKGVSAVTLVANHVPVNARVIGANEHESHYIFDLLFNNTSEIKPDVLSTDTHGVNHVNFALLDLFDYTFAPRYAQFGRVIEEMFTVNVSNEDKPVLSLKKPIRADAIVQEWETIQRIVISLQRKTTSQAALIRKLSTYSNTHPLVQALTEYDRLVKASYLLNYIDDAALRNYVQRALNRGEAYHRLRRAVASVNGNRFRGSSDQEIDIWNECARLLTNAIIYFNSLILSNLLAYYRAAGDQENLELVKKVSPVAWLNVNLNGTYSFTFEQNMINMTEILSPLTGESGKPKK
ncbi:MAG TPA: Tn3 family transposase [Marinobacter adhaerens]|uniref:Tn3 family transposase n=1 Tax=Marinobacter adhaerens TaxID=1033846 RepID=A0A352IZ66_9GAMM|nr:Tn3 family transposase [Marinobacter adhaerens]